MNALPGGPGGSDPRRACDTGQGRGQGDPPVAEAKARLRAFLDGLDEKTRRPGEPLLREAVAQQARERLAEMNSDDPVGEADRG